VKQGHKECETREMFTLHDPAHKDTRDDSCGVCGKWSSHVTRASVSKQEYRGDVEASQRGVNTALMYSAYLQKVIMLPRRESLKLVLFTRHIVALNENFVPVGTNPENFVEGRRKTL